MISVSTLLIANSLVISLPTLLLGLAGISVPEPVTVFWCLWVAINLLCFVDSFAMHAASGGGCPTPSIIAGDLRPANPFDRVLCFAFGISLLVFFWIVLVSQPVSHSAALIVIGLLLVAGGCSLRWRAIKILGNAFVSEVAPLRASRVRVDVYRFVVHPGEIGLHGAVAGLALISGATVPLLFWLVCLIPLSVLRCYREEIAMCIRFGNHLDINTN